jgi:hypothetical protein
MERITWIIIGYRVSCSIPNSFLTRITQPNRRSNRCRTRTFPPHLLSAHSDVFVLIVCSKQGEIIARLTVHATLRGESKIALAAAASLMA